MDCAKCLDSADHNLWVMLSNGSHVCVKRMSDVGARIVEVINDLAICQSPKPTASYTGAWVALGLGGTFAVGLVGALIYTKIKERRAQSRINAVVDQLPLHPIVNRDRNQEVEAVIDMPNDNYVEMDLPEEPNLMNFDVELELIVNDEREPANAADLQADVDRNDHMIPPALPVQEPEHPLVDLLQEPVHVRPIPLRRTTRVRKEPSRLINEM